jgi:hypothetical protein
VGAGAFAVPEPADGEHVERPVACRSPPKSGR